MLKGGMDAKVEKYGLKEQLSNDRECAMICIKSESRRIAMNGRTTC
jgi:hypothetical protein